MCFLLNSRSHTLAKAYDCYTILSLYNTFIFNYKVYTGELYIIKEWPNAYAIRTNKINTNFERKIVNNLLSINFNICFGSSKNRLIETVLLSTHNICFG